MTPESLKDLLDQYLQGRLTSAQRAEFSDLMSDPANQLLLESALEESFMSDEFVGEEFSGRQERITSRLLENIQERQVQPERSKLRLLSQPWFRLAVACIFIFAILGIYYWSSGNPSSDNRLAKSSAPTTDIAPGKNGAILTLADGSKIVLDSVQSGKLAQQGTAELVLQSNQLAYQNNKAQETQVTYNTLEVPRGRQFQLVLQDGTKVWLNADSRLRYPTSFPGNERVVEISGEAYFEVAHDANKPFKVKKGDTEIVVLGTHFNVHAYDEEAIEEVTLLEGSVNVKSKKRNITIRPGQQARISQDLTVTDDVDTDEVVAWKDGKFQFGETADIKSVMLQISRWYDVDVRYEGMIKNHIGGTISRDVKLSQLLKVLETTGAVKFGVEGRTIVVKP